jgi:hypothetical protein
MEFSRWQKEIGFSRINGVSIFLNDIEKAKWNRQTPLDMLEIARYLAKRP